MLLLRVWKSPILLLEILPRSPSQDVTGTAQFHCEKPSRVKHIQERLWFVSAYIILRASQVVPVVKNPPANAGDIRDVGLIPGAGRSLEEEMAIHSIILSWRIHGQRSLVCFSPWGHKGSDTTEQLNNNKWFRELLSKGINIKTFGNFIKWARCFNLRGKKNNIKAFEESRCFVQTPSSDQRLQNLFIRRPSDPNGKGNYLKICHFWRSKMESEFCYCIYQLSLI